MPSRLSLAAVAAVSLLAGGAALAPIPISAADAPTVADGCITSVPEPGTADGVPICYSLFRPGGASAAAPVPLVFHSHGWGGSRTTDAASFAAWFEAGFGVLSFDQRGFGESGGKAHVEHPEFEGEDVRALVDLVAAQDWVVKDGPGDPRIGAIGGSYGGGYQFVGAFTDLMVRGDTRFDALAPEITWWDLRESLAPQETVRTLWVSALYAAGADAHTDDVHRGFAYGAATGNWPKGEAGLADLDAFFEKNGPAWHVQQGRRLDIPVLFGQGFTDNLFNGNQGLKNFVSALTDSARSRSIFVGYNGGHVLPSALPAGTGTGGDPCSQQLAGGSFSDLARRFMRETLKGEATGLTGHGRYHLATADAARCVTVDSVEATTAFELGQVVTTAGPGAPVAWKVADGPLTVAGTPTVDANVTSVGVEARAFLALAVGTTQADAQIVQNNTMPLREPLPVTAAERSIELPAVAVEVPEGQSLFLVVSPFADMSFGHGSRVPGAVVLDGTVVRVPVVGAP